MAIKTTKGSPLPLGTSAYSAGVNFALFIEDLSKSPIPPKLIIKDIGEFPIFHSTGNILHIALFGLPSSFSYCFQWDGYDLLDPYAKSLLSPQKWEDKSPYRPWALFNQELPFDWGEDKRPNIEKQDLILYEMHVRGYTQDPSSCASFPGTYLGIIEKIPHLKALGINAVELMPIAEFNPYEYPLPDSPYYGKIMQYWGYSSVNFFAPMNRYSSGRSLDAARTEFKQMVRALHEAGIEVILDVVFNHTAEGNEKGPVFHFKVLGKETYYFLDPEGPFSNYSGCGNTFRHDHPIPADLILASLRYFVSEMHIDGFRFDLAAIFYRGGKGAAESVSALLNRIKDDPILSTVKLIVEPWDAAGLYLVGHFYPQGTHFSEWNAQYRDSVRQFIQGRPGLKGEFARRLSGSHDLYHYGSPQNSLNFITCHDGFTLHDLVAYNHKHNLANGEDNRDGANENYSWNCGVEGMTDDPQILELRLRQMRNFHLALMISQGIPMILMGDEYGHSKQGNNNSWCQDNRTNWFLWDVLEKEQAFFQYFAGLIHFRNENPLLKQRAFLTERAIEWHGKTPFNPNWELEDHFIAFTLLDPQGGPDIFAAFNAGENTATLHFPEPRPGKAWNWIANSSLPLSMDVHRKNHPLEETIYEMAPYSSLLLFCDNLKSKPV